MDNILFISHCTINSYSKVVSFKKAEEYEYELKDFLNFIYENDIGIVQLPCPEMHCYGLRRWGHVREQFDHPHYRKECRKLIEPIIDQIIEYEQNDFNVIGIMGMFGSPSCGVTNTCSGDWYGELGSNKNLESMVSSVNRVGGMGIFIEEIKRALEEEKLKIPLLEYNKKYLDRTIKEVENLIK